MGGRERVSGTPSVHLRGELYPFGSGKLDDSPFQANANTFALDSLDCQSRLCEISQMEVSHGIAATIRSSPILSMNP